MSFYKPQFEDLIERTLKDYDRQANTNLYSDTAVNLLLGTAAQESGFGTYLRQLGGGPALGVFQMERPTFNWLRNTYEKKIDLQNITYESQEWNLRYAILFARLRYYIMPEALPKNEIEDLAVYWKKYYNTFAGAGTVNEFITNYLKYVVD